MLIQNNQGQHHIKNVYVIDLILSFKHMDILTLCQMERCLSLFLTHCDVAWYIN
mgnify:CR=1 FL=1